MSDKSNNHVPRKSNEDVIALDCSPDKSVCVDLTKSSPDRSINTTGKVTGLTQNSPFWNDSSFSPSIVKQHYSQRSPWNETGVAGNVIEATYKSLDPLVGI